MPNKQFFLSYEKFEKVLFVLYVRDLPVVLGGHPQRGAAAARRHADGRGCHRGLSGLASDEGVALAPCAVQEELDQLQGATGTRHVERG